MELIDSISQQGSSLQIQLHNLPIERLIMESQSEVTFVELSRSSAAAACVAPCQSFLFMGRKQLFEPTGVWVAQSTFFLLIRIVNSVASVFREGNFIIGTIQSSEAVVKLYLLESLSLNLTTLTIELNLMMCFWLLLGETLCDFCLRTSHMAAYSHKSSLESERLAMLEAAILLFTS